MRVISAAFLYFAIVFVFAFALGTVRTLWLEPAIGEFWAVLCEAPFLLGAIFFAAPRALRWAKLEGGAGSILWMGVLALVFQEVAEIGLVIAGGETVEQHLRDLGSPSGRIYVTLLAAFVLAPLFVAKRVWPPVSN